MISKTMITAKFSILICLGLFLILILANTSAAHDITAPEVIDKDPKDKEVDVAIDIDIEVAFSEPMQAVITEEAFSVSPENSDEIIAGEIDWFGTTLIFTPTSKLESGTTYHINISSDARDLIGNNLVKNYTWSFSTVAGEKNKGKNDDSSFNWEVWEPIVTVITILGTAIVAFIGFYKLRLKRSQLRRYIGKLDELYEKFRKDPYVCEHKLNQLKESLKIKFRRGEMEENHYLIMDKKIDDYLSEVRYRKTLTKPKIVKGVEGEILQELEKTVDDKKGIRMEPAGLDEGGDQPRPERTDKPQKPPKRQKTSKRPPGPKIIPD
jgi:hypothetical protein